LRPFVAKKQFTEQRRDSRKGAKIAKKNDKRETLAILAAWRELKMYFCGSKSLAKSVYKNVIFKTLKYKIVIFVKIRLFFIKRFVQADGCDLESFYEAVTDTWNRFLKLFSPPPEMLTAI